ncbi:hypothetical protein GCM10011344_27640 [Dokdonia pacifica]|uniref:HTH cro/C1-type domain-containing protein n=1 Tax=Dokdonia pacifica TaxID=1627892 RepID=A0A239CGI9_9FLAO|nr:helix-turn-helix domain-containing protein [Dokdonia pacifica]GGG25452.1 hypothetical protein GCM10011344_27640 [Dokdonia pacifica]SNS18463.1 hypothetical protein SAMN06265376_107281 [Dokdonia pacifica]
MPICSIDLHTTIPHPAGYPTSLDTIYDHIKARRIDRGLSKVELAKILDVNPLTIGTWENHHKHLIPRMRKKIINWLGYVPPLGVDENTLWGRLYIYRSIHGLTQKNISDTLKIDSSSITKIEKNEDVNPSYYKKIKELIENR